MKKSNNKGFTFIELVIYIGILSIFMIAITTLVGSTVTSNRKMTARRQIQNSASEAYDALSDMLMGATDVMIYGQAYTAYSSSAATTGCFVIAEEDPIKDTGTGAIYGVKPSGETADTPNTISVAGSSVTCYDIADVMSYGDLDASADATDIEKTYIQADDSGMMYIYIKYGSAIDSTEARDTEFTYCTIIYDADHEVIYVHKSTDASDESSFVYTANSEDVLCKDVKSFRLQVNPDEDSFSITIDLEDDLTSVSYSVSGIVSLRNSYVLTKHTW